MALIDSLETQKNCDSQNKTFITLVLLHPSSQMPSNPFNTRYKAKAIKHRICLSYNMGVPIIVASYKFYSWD